MGISAGFSLWYSIYLWPFETHRDPCTQQLQYEFAGVARIVGHVVGQNHALRPFGSHHTHGRRRYIGGKAAAIDREPVPLGKVDEHGRAATARVHPPCWRSWFQPSLLKKLRSLDAAHPILAVQDVVRTAIFGQDGIGAGPFLMTTTCCLAT